MLLNLEQRAGLRKCDMGNWVVREEMIGGVVVICSRLLDGLSKVLQCGTAHSSALIPVLVTGIQVSPVLGLRRVLPVVQTHGD
jgi:hypothetical protein